MVGVRVRVINQKYLTDKLRSNLSKTNPRWSKSLFRSRTVKGADSDTMQPEDILQCEQASAKQREHLARIRVKAAESRRQKTAQRRQQQQRPATARSTPHPTFSDGDVDRLLDRYKERRKAKKAVKTKPDSSALQQSPAHTINADLHTVAPVDDPWAECFL